MIPFTIIKYVNFSIFLIHLPLHKALHAPTDPRSVLIYPKKSPSIHLNPLDKKIRQKAKEITRL